MEVLTIEAQTFKDMESMFYKMAAMVKEQTKENAASNIVLLSCKEVSKLTGFGVQTIKIHKEEIGYQTLGKDLRFKPSDVEAWINKYYRKPKIR